MLERVPALLKQHPQWLLWRQGSKEPLQANGYAASVTKPNTWCSFDSAMAALQAHQPNPANRIGGAGFVLGGASGVSGTDLDKCLNPDGSIIDHNAVEIARRFQTYTEVSPSGTGLHCLYLANVTGRRADRYEMYGSGRYFTMTGNVYIDLPIIARQTEADEFAKFLDAKRAKSSNMNVDWAKEPTLTNEQLWQRCCTSAKFLALYNGDISDYPSHSEASIALTNMIAFWSDSPNQVMLAFSSSPLCASQREDKYRKRPTLLQGMVAKAFDRKVPVADLARVYVAQPAPVSKPVIIDEIDAAEASDPFTMPPGGGAFSSIAQFVYQQSKYPMKQAALAAALTLMAGICGRQYQYEKSGLNLYILLAAETGSGKEAMSTGIGRLMDAVCNPPLDPNPTLANMSVPAARAFQGPTELTGSGLLQALYGTPQLSMFSILTEIADTMAEMSDKHGNSGIKSLKKQLLILYMAASEGTTYAGKVVADKKQSIERMASPSFTMLGECTPDRLYETMTPQLIADGLLPRFVVFENKKFKDRYHNKGHSDVQVPPELQHWLQALCNNVLEMKLKNNDRRIYVQHTHEAAERSEYYREYASKRLEGNDNTDATRELWNRSHLIAVRMAALVAIGCDMHTPTITVEQMDWAWQIVQRQVLLLVGKFKRNEVGDQSLNSTAQVEEIMKACRHFLTMQPGSFAGQTAERILEDGRNAGYIPYSYIQMRTGGNRAAFKGLPHAKAVKEAIEVAISSGLLRRQFHPEHKEAKYYEII